MKVICGCCGQEVDDNNARRYPEVDAENDVCCNPCAEANGIDWTEAFRVIEPIDGILQMIKTA